MTSERELLIARHGEAEASVARIIAGPRCTGLTTNGRAQAAALARYLADRGVVEIYASTTPRARVTAEIVGAALGVEVRDCPDLRVPDPGAAEGHVWSAARERWPTDPQNPTRPLADDGESWSDYMGRAMHALGELLSRHCEGRVLVVGHSETVAAMFGLLLGTPNLGRLKVELGHCSLSTWRATQEWAGASYPEQRWSLVAHNDAGETARLSPVSPLSPNRP